MKKNAPLVMFAVAILICVGPARAGAQAVANADIHGTITDPSGAAVPNASVSVTETSTGMKRATASNSYGSYLLPNLPVGPYTLTVQASGFKAYTQSGIILVVGENVSINVRLVVGAMSQRVLVSANTTMVQTQETSMSEVVGQARMVDLPLNGRLATSLILLSGASLNSPVPGDLDSTKSYANTAVIDVAGGQGNSALYLLDGGVNNDMFYDTNLPYPFPDAVQEFSVQTNGLSARYGLYPGAVVNVITKSGTNQFHGDLFEFVRNGAFNARNYFAATQDTLRRNQYGGTIGGPIKKNKLFAFFGYQGTKNRTAPPTSIAFDPTAAVLNGDWSTIESAQCTSSHQAVSLINPVTGQPFANNVIPTTMYNAQALNLLKYIPVSSNPCGEDIYSVSTPSNEFQVVGRVDYTISSKQSMYGRYLIDDYNAPVSFNGTDLLPTSGNALYQRSQALVLSHSYSISPTALNNFIASWTRLRDNRSPAAGLPTPEDLGVNAFQYAPDFISVDVENYFNVCNCGAPGFFNRNTMQFSDDIDLVRGRNTITFGADYIHDQNNAYDLFEGNGDFSFDGEYTGSSLADFMLGDLYQLTQGGAQEYNLRQNYIGLYAQDNVRLNSRFNFHVGLRWEPALAVSNEFPWQSHFSLTDFESDTVSKEFVNAPAGLLFADDGVDGWYNSHYAEFEPRVGLVWDPTGSGKQTIRTSYGIFDNSSAAFYSERATDEAPWATTVTLTSPVGGFTNPYLDYPGGNPFPSPFPPKSTVAFPAEGVFYNFPSNLQPTYMQQWDLSYERQLSPNWIVSATYLGNRTSHLWGAIEEDPAEFLTQAQCAAAGISASTCQTTASTNQRRKLYLLDPTLGSKISTMGLTWDGASGSYNGLILSAHHRFSKDYTVLLNYTYSHCLSDANFDSALAGPTVQNPADPNADYGNCSFDVRHNFVVSFVAQSPHFSNLWANRLLGNWQLSPIISYHSGEWFNPATGTDNSLTGVGLDRPDQVLANPYLRETNTNTHLWLNPAAYKPNPLGTFGDVGAYSVVGPSYFDIDADLSRFFQMPWSEHQRLELRFEFFNLGNNVNFENPTSTLTSPEFGEILGANPERILQFALKYHF